MIRFENISKSYSKRIQALDNINFTIEDGEFVFLIGPSGAGKTSIMKLLLKEEKPSSGAIYVAGKDITNLRRSQIAKHRKSIGVVYQDFRLLENRNVFDNIKFALEIHGYSKRYMKDKVNEVIDLMELRGREKSMPNELSGGEKQRTSMARALVNRPSILIADEPTGNLDPVTAEEIVKSLLKINENGTTVLMITHSKKIVDSLEKRVIRLENGKIVSDKEQGTYI